MHVILVIDFMNRKSLFAAEAFSLHAIIACSFFSFRAESDQRLYTEATPVALLGMVTPGAEL